MLVLFQADAVATTPLNVTTLLPCEGPNPVPVMSTVPPAGVDVGASDVTATLLNDTLTVYVPVEPPFGSSQIV
jgi:hypothetical protein